MSRFTGPQHRGAARDDRREARLEAGARDDRREARLEAGARDDVTPADRRRPNPTPPEKDCE